MNNGHYNEENRYVVEHEVLSYEVDNHKVLSPVGFMDWAQEMAYQAAEALGFGYSRMDVDHYAWVLSRFHITFPAPPSWRDKVEISTWHKGTRGPFFVRDFMVCDASGKREVLGTSSWIVLNEQTRSMVRMSELPSVVPEGSDSKFVAIDPVAPKLMMPRGSEPSLVKEHVVEYQDLDFIGHTNNVRYVEWSLGCIDTAFLAEHPLRDLQINFVHETHAGEKVGLWLLRQEAEGSQAVFFVEGRLPEGQVAFILRLEF